MHEAGGHEPGGHEPGGPEQGGPEQGGHDPVGHDPRAGEPGDPAAGSAASEDRIALGDVDGPDERLESRVVVYWYLTDLVRTTVMASVLIYGAEFWHAHEGKHAWAPPVAWGVGALLILLALVTPPLAYARWRFSVDDRLMAMRYGILWVEERRVPVPRMQHVDLTRGPIERLFGLATLVVFTAGNEGSAFRVPGLGIARAQALRDRILRARGRDVI